MKLCLFGGTAVPCSYGAIPGILFAGVAAMLKGGATLVLEAGDG